MASVTVACSGCGTLQTRELADNLTPLHREAILARALHRFECASCRRITIVEKELTYTDFERAHWIGLFPRREMVRHEELARAVGDAFRRAMIDAAAPSVRRSADEFQVRVVFGYEQLREKLVAWDAGLDDQLLEMLKLELILARPELVEIGLVGLTLDSANDEWLMFRGFGKRFQPVQGYQGGLVPRALYREFAEKVPLPSGERGLFVNLLKHFDVLSPAADPDTVEPPDK